MEEPTFANISACIKKQKEEEGRTGILKDYVITEKQLNEGIESKAIVFQDYHSDVIEVGFINKDDLKHDYLFVLMKHNYHYASNLVLEITLPALPNGMYWKNQIGLELINNIDLFSMINIDNQVLRFSYYQHEKDFDIFDYSLEERQELSKNEYTLRIPINVYNDSDTRIRPFIASAHSNTGFKIKLNDINELIENKDEKIIVNLKYQYHYKRWFVDYDTFELYDSTTEIPSDLRPKREYIRPLMNPNEVELLTNKYDEYYCQYSLDIEPPIEGISGYLYKEFYITVFNIETNQYEDAIRTIDAYEFQYQNKNKIQSQQNNELQHEDNYEYICNGFKMENYNKHNLTKLQRENNLPSGYYILNSPGYLFSGKLRFHLNITNFSPYPSNKYRINIVSRLRNTHRTCQGVYGNKLS